MNAARLILLVPLVAALACTAGAVNRGTTSRTDPNVISTGELASATHLNLHALVSHSRPRWLDTRRTTTFDGRQTAITVFLNGQRFGEVEQLRSMSLNSVKEIRYYGVAEAQQRFSLANLGTVINVITQQ